MVTFALIRYTFIVGFLMACASHWLSRSGLAKPRKEGTDWDFPGGTVVKNVPIRAGDTYSSPGLGRTHMPRSS